MAPAHPAKLSGVPSSWPSLASILDLLGFSVSPLDDELLKTVVSLATIVALALSPAIRKC